MSYPNISNAPQYDCGECEEEFFTLLGKNYHWIREHKS